MTAAYRLRAIVACDGRDGVLVGRVDQVWDQRPPILYRLTLPRTVAPWYAYEADLREATEAEAAAWHAASGLPKTAPPGDVPPPT